MHRRKTSAVVSPEQNGSSADGRTGGLFVEGEDWSSVDRCAPHSDRYLAGDQTVWYCGSGSVMVPVICCKHASACCTSTATSIAMSLPRQSQLTFPW